MDDATKTMIANLKEKTGKSLEQWTAVAKKSGAAKHGEIVKLLKSDYGLTHGYANLVAHNALKSHAAALEEGGTDLVAEQYAGDKAGLKPVHDAIIVAAKSLGKDVEIAPKKAYVSLRRKTQFAIVQPSTKSRVDLGLNIKGAPANGRLELSGSFNAMVSHRVRLEAKKDVDAEVKAWLKAAYDKAG